MSTNIPLPYYTVRPQGLPHISGRPRLGTLLMVSLLLFFCCGPLLRQLDPAAAAVDTGVLSLLVLSLLALFVFATLSRGLLDLMLPGFRNFRHYFFLHHFKSLVPWQKVVVYLAAYFLLLYAFVFCLMAVI